MTAIPSLLTPGCIVRHPQCPDWGVGQVQSVVGMKATVNFEERGKVVINLAVVDLDLLETDRD
ncbi:hypothetical protein GCM10011497_32090 [Elstera cyanobacteriorum]|uniref:DUF3553 domain-containing protein n=1 Tax=Elstera cyanobacteriorum TaxID=2022747 RepID=A0A255XU33_9PROT|nr:DUF3553 domain-containing protein [Elstera cyanobacteriorum]OYQ20422.1 DUF3553 domain-containing protein [Elstera cyanobacteriorum]GFZ99029.1 hypothetical protein GCM10011497_32090 [Elstera cyanobacteriorum]